MKLYKSKVVTGTANNEVLSAILTSTSTEQYHIERVYATEITSTLQNDAYIRINIERETIADIPVMHWLNNITSASRVAMEAIDIDYDLPVGESLYVGHLSGATASDIVYTVEYEIKR